MNQQFQRIERLPPNVFNIIGELKQAARAWRCRQDLVLVNMARHACD